MGEEILSAEQTETCEYTIHNTQYTHNTYTQHTQHSYAIHTQHIHTTHIDIDTTHIQWLTTLVNLNYQ